MMKIVTPTSVYIHIPFCSHKCYYCDFTAYHVDGQPVDQYLTALAGEMALVTEQTPPEEIQTIYVGGGTPTILTPKQMESLLQVIKRHFPKQAENLEFTVEANPESTSLALLETMKAGGVNRISFGVQTFQPTLLKEIGRIHGIEEILRSIALAKQVGIENISLDLMFGLPKQTVQDMEETLTQVISLKPQHLSAYSLKIEEGTRFQHLYERDQLPLPTEDDEFLMYEMIRSRLANAGYQQYEVSNFAYPGYESKHNTTYWLNENYYGFGTGAHGYIGQTRYANIKGIKAYIEAVQNGQRPIAEERIIEQREDMENFMILGLRLLQGVKEKRFWQRYGQAMNQVFGDVLRSLYSRGLIVNQNGIICLTEKGLLFGNDVFASFLED